jgi:hypothetical protein
MRFKAKLLIFIVAVVLSVLWFNLIASSSVCLLKFAKELPYEEIEKYRASYNFETFRIRQPDFKDSEFASLSPDPGESR